MAPRALAELLAVPLQSAVRAQVLAAQETMSAIEDVGIENGRAKMFRLLAERTVEERIVDPQTGVATTGMVTHAFQVSIPVLAMVPIQPVKLQEMNVDMAVDVLEVVGKSVRSKAFPSGTTLADTLVTFVSLGRPEDSTMKISMRIAQEKSEGIGRIGDLLADTLSGRVTSDKGVASIPGVAPIVTKLEAVQIVSVSDYIAQTVTETDRQHLARSLGVPVSQVQAWRRAALRIAGS